EASLSPAHLQRLFKRITGISPRQYADACRLALLKARLKERRTVTMALYEAGYSSSSRLYERAAGQLGMTPRTYQRGGRTVTIRSCVTVSPLGRRPRGAGARGVGPVSRGARDGERGAGLRRESPAATIARDDAELRAWADELLAHLHGRQPHLDLPLDVRATAF